MRHTGLVEIPTKEQLGQWIAQAERNATCYCLAKQATTKPDLKAFASSMQGKFEAEVEFWLTMKEKL